MRSIIRIGLILMLVVVLGVACGSGEVRYEGPEEVEPQSEAEQRQQQQTHDLMNMQQQIREQAQEGGTQ